MSLIPAVLARPGTGRRRFLATRADLRHQLVGAGHFIDDLRSDLRRTACQLGTSVVEAAEERAGRGEAEAKLADREDLRAAMVLLIVVNIALRARIGNELDAVDVVFECRPDGDALVTPLPVPLYAPPPQRWRNPVVTLHQSPLATDPAHVPA